MIPILGGLIVAASVDVVRMWSAMKTGDAQLDRPGIRLRGAAEIVLKFGPFANSSIGQAWMGLIYQESRGDPANYIGDVGLAAAGGASGGPGQVSFATAQQLGIVSESMTLEQYTALMSTDEGFGVRASVKVFHQKYIDNGGDLYAAVMAYNGSGPSAVAYQGQVLAWLQSTFGTSTSTDTSLGDGSTAVAANDDPTDAPPDDGSDDGSTVDSTEVLPDDSQAEDGT